MALVAGSVHDWLSQSSYGKGGSGSPAQRSGSYTMTNSLLLGPALGAAFTISFAASSSSALHKCHNNNSHRIVIRCSKAGEPLRRPSRNAPPASPSTLPPPEAPAVDLSPVPSVSPPSNSKVSGVTIEFQRQRAKEMQEYFLDKKFEDQTSQSRIFGWTRKNEITNGRWVMFGLAVGLLTEFATGSDFVEQLKIIISNLGIADVD